MDPSRPPRSWSAFVILGAFMVTTMTGGCLLWFGGTLIVSPRIQSPYTYTPTPVAISSIPTPIPDGKMSVAPEISSDFIHIEQEIIQIRGLLPRKGVPIEILSQEEHQERTRAELEEDQEEWEGPYAGMLSTLGLIDSKLDIGDAYIDLYSNAVAGYYDTEKEYFTVIISQDYPTPEEGTMAHEYVHALQDQYYDLDEGLKISDAHCSKQRTDTCTAILALVEGDATLTEYLWQTDRGGDLFDRMSMNNLILLGDFIPSIPSFMEDEFTFPYIYGYSFVSEQHAIDGWDAVNSIYANPPLSTEQIMHPERYPEDIPVRVELDGDAIEEGVSGEWGLFLILANSANAASRLPRAAALRAVDGWEGDYYKFSQFPDTYIHRTLWDDPGEAREFFSALCEHLSRRWYRPVITDGLATWNDQGAIVSLKDASVTWIISNMVSTSMDTLRLVETQSISGEEAVP